MKDMPPARYQTIEVIVTAGDVSLEEVFGRRRGQRVLLVRRAICLAMRDVHRMSLPEIGDVFGTSHAVALHRIRVGRRQLKEEASLLAMAARSPAPEDTPLTSLLRTAYTRLGLHEWPDEFSRPKPGREAGAQPAEAAR